MSANVVVVTGVPGLTGNLLCAALGDRYEVHAVSRRPAPPELAANLTWHHVDLSRSDFTSRLPGQVDALVHLAQSRRFREFPSGAPDMFAVNVDAVAHLLEWARSSGAKHVTIASSGSVYRPSVGALRESDPLSPGTTGFYAATKLSSELLASAYTGEFVVTTLRPFFIYGPGQEASMLVPSLIRSIRSGNPVRLAGPDGFRFTPTHVTDVVQAVEASLETKDSNVINIGGPEVLTLRGACELIGNFAGVAPVFEEAAAPPAGDFIPDLSRMRSLLVAPSIGFADGLATLAADGPLLGRL